MHNFKKVISSVVVTILLFTVVSWTIIAPYMNSEFSYFQDNKLRESIAGEIDVIAIGASHGLNAFDTGILDASLDCFSYNLSASMMTLDSKYYLLKKELDRNPVETVILELSFDTLARNESAEFAIGDEVTIARLDSFGERMNYMLRYMKIDDWLNLYSRQIVTGLARYLSMLHGSEMNSVDYGAKGYCAKNTADVTLSEEQVPRVFNSRSVVADYPEKNIAKLNSIVELCKEHDVRIIVTVVPLSDALIWENDGWDDFYHWTTLYCEENDCEFYDLNLIRNRYELFNDRESFSDADHLCSDGAEVFTKAFCDIINRVDAGEDISHLFYSSYAEMKQDSPYAVYLGNLGS
jgi:hypothetical protein